MAEYWKSTPKYWCKFCSDYVRDTKFERAQHEATGRHQGNIQRSLRSLHKEQEIEARKKQSAKNEIARLNGLVPGASSSASSGTGSALAAAAASDPRVGATPTFTRPKEQQASVADRRKQWEQLVAMGISMPEEVRGNMAMPGDWQVVSERVIDSDGNVEEKKPLSTGVHKRKLNEEEEELEAAGATITKKKGWGQTFKTFPGKMGGDDEDLDGLFRKKKKKKKTTTIVKQEESGPASVVVKKPDLKQEESTEVPLDTIPAKEEAPKSRFTKVGQSTGEASNSINDVTVKTEEDIAVKDEEEAPAPTVVFKKRKKR